MNTIRNEDTKTDKQRISRRLLGLLLSAIVGISLLSACDELITEVTLERIAGNPTAEFIIDPPNTGFADSGCVEFTVRFLDKSDGPRDVWLWNFGDGDTSSDTNPTHIYDSAGTYTVKLEITDTETGGFDFEVKNRFIIVGTSASGFTFDTGQLCTKDTVTFIPTLGGATSWSWDFGDGSVASTDTFPRYSYSAPGVYQVTFSISGDCGIDSVQDSITISDCPNAAFVFDTAIGCESLLVTFSDSSVLDSTEVITLRSWDFGDGATLDTTANTVEHTYTVAGTYSVTLTVTSSNNSTDTVTLADIITLHDPTIVGFTSQNSPQDCFSQFQQFVVKFLDTSQGDITSRIWEFGDGTFDSTNNPEPLHAYSPGLYDVKLIITGVCGAVATTDSVTQIGFVFLDDVPQIPPITIIPHPTDPTGTMYFFADSTLGEIITRVWDFGDGVPADSSTAFIAHTFPDTGSATYIISVTNTNTCGTSVRSDSVIVTIP
ncbi:PKD domain-containing protein [Gemmatimonas aurantiaca]|nr:PKD domain-containing protein [Gemmatimonas aurantiaca]